MASSLGKRRRSILSMLIQSVCWHILSEVHQREITHPERVVSCAAASQQWFES